MMSDYKVEMVNDGMQEFFVEFKGPAESNNPRAESQPPPSRAESRFLPSLCLPAG
jgi:hypothetical protein